MKVVDVRTIYYKTTINQKRIRKLLQLTIPGCFEGIYKIIKKGLFLALFMGRNVKKSIVGCAIALHCNNKGIYVRTKCNGSDADQKQGSFAEQYIEIS